MSVERIAKIIISEIIEAFIFAILITACNEFSKYLPTFDSCSSIYLLWTFAGLATPIVIWLEIEDDILHALGRIIGK